MSHVVPLEKYTNSADISEPCELISDVFCFHKQLSLYNGNRTEWSPIYKGLFTWRWRKPA